MRKFISHVIVFALIFTLGLAIDSVYAGKGNNFPSGEHYNLNLIAKKSDPSLPSYFQCPTEEEYVKYDWYLTQGIEGQCRPSNDITNCIQCYEPNVGDCTIAIQNTNVIFVPRDNDVNGDLVPDEQITIKVMSGSDRATKGRKIKDAYPILTVTDWCTEHFPDDDPNGDEAVFQLPENANGYLVYARLTGKPVVENAGTTWTFTSPSFPSNAMTDEYGNDLIYMGKIGGPEADCTDGDGNVVLERINTGKGQGKGKGVNMATDISCLFEFTGDVCYFNDLCYYCEDPPDSGNDVCYPFGDFPVYLGGHVCCDTPEEIDPLLDSCDPAQPVLYNCELRPHGDCDPYTEECEWGDCPGLIDETQIDVVPECRHYDSTWVFNIADFVDVLWKSETGGAYVIQLRFYPQ